MDDRDNRKNGGGIDSDRAEGGLKQAGGKVKEGAGKLLGDGKMETEGKADQVEGKVQNAWGGIKDKARETFAHDDDSRD